MSINVTSPPIDSRTYQDLLDEALARIPVHNPEWTNFNHSDPGITLVELFAFLTESLLYRANQIPERNRLAFLSLLGVPLAPASSALGIVTFANDNGPLAATTLAGDVEVRAGQIPFRTDIGLDVLPVDVDAYYKQPVPSPPQQLVDYYRSLYASYSDSPNQPDTSLQLYETVALAPPLEHQENAGVDLAQTVDASLWIALLLRNVDGTGAPQLAAARDALAGRTLSLGIIPVLDNPDAQLSPLGRSMSDGEAHLDYQLPRVDAGGSLGADAADRIARYRSLDASGTVNVLDQPGIVQLTLPDAGGLTLWNDVDPLEAGVGDLPPALDDATLGTRTITWLRITATGGTQAKLLWAGINAATVAQRASVVGEVLPNGTGAPDQVVRLANTPVLTETVTLTVGDPPVAWTATDDLFSAGPEVPVPDSRRAPGSPQPPPTDPHVYAVDAATGTVMFGDGLHGARPPADSPIRATYAYGAGTAGNVGPGTINSSPALPSGIKVTNPVRTWGGAAAGTVDEATKQIPQYLRHRDRLVSAGDFETIVRATPGIDVGRIEVVPAYNPELSTSSPGDAPGAVTLMVIPRVDLVNPTSPQPDQPFLDAICSYIDPRRLVTSEVFLRGPTYVAIWVSIGFDPVSGQSIADVRDAIKAAILQYLAPLGTDTGPPPAGPAATSAAATASASYPHAATGWPLLKPVVPLELLAVATRVPGVDLVRPVLLAQGDAVTDGSASISMGGLQLPAVAGISVLSGDPLPLDQLRGLAAPSSPTLTTVVPIPVVPDSC
jgi:hypothetical protein